MKKYALIVILLLMSQSLISETLFVKGKVLNFREEPNGKKIGVLYSGTEIEQVDNKGEWARVKVYGWVYKPLTEIKEAKYLQKSNGDCSDYIRIVEDKLTDDRIIVTKKIFVTKDEGKYGFRIRGMALEEKNTIALNIKAVGAGNCIEEGSKINILFRDGSKMELKNVADFNYEAETHLLLGKSLGTETELKNLMTKEVEIMRVQTRDGYVQEDFTKQNSIDFMMSLKCLNEYIE